MGRGRALGTAAMPRVREDEGDPNLQCELSSDRQNGGGSSIFMQVLPIPGSTLSKSGKERFFTCSKGVEGCRYVNDEVNEPINR